MNATPLTKTPTSTPPWMFQAAPGGGGGGGGDWESGGNHSSGGGGDPGSGWAPVVGRAVARQVTAAGGLGVHGRTRRRES